jgi:hypothetical protein
MLSKKEYNFLLICSIALGILMSMAIYIFMFAAIVFAFAAILLLFILLFDVFKAKEKIKIHLKYLALCLISFLIFFSVDTLLFKYLEMKRDEAVSKIYRYKKLQNQFPSDAISADIDAKKFRYFPDASLMNFTIHYFDRYGMPMEFNSKDSIWTR